MNITDIEKLLEKYFDAKTSPEEERIILDFFASDDVPKHLMQYKAQFGYFSDAKKIKISSNEFDDKVMAEIDSIPEPIMLRKPVIYRIAAVAAVFILAVVSAFIIFKKSNDPFLMSDGTHVDPVITYEQTKITLASISGYLNLGIEKMQKLTKINKGAEQVNKISKIYEAKDLIIKTETTQ